MRGLSMSILSNFWPILFIIGNEGPWVETYKSKVSHIFIVPFKSYELNMEEVSRDNKQIWLLSYMKSILTISLKWFIVWILVISQKIERSSRYKTVYLICLLVLNSSRQSRHTTPDILFFTRIFRQVFTVISCFSSEMSTNQKIKYVIG